jgi:hypothetical protein
MEAKLKSFSSQPLKKWVFDQKWIKEPMKHLYAFDRKRIESIRVITL